MANSSDWLTALLQRPLDKDETTDAEQNGRADWLSKLATPDAFDKGEFVGGCDIITEMTLSGELDQLFEENGVSYDKDAADKIREANAEE